MAAIAELVTAATVTMADTAEEEEAEEAMTTTIIPAAATATTTAMDRQGAEMRSLRLGRLTVGATTIPDLFPADRISPVLGVAGIPVDAKIRIDVHAA